MGCNGMYNQLGNYNDKMLPFGGALIAYPFLVNIADGLSLG